MKFEFLRTNLSLLTLISVGAFAFALDAFADAPSKATLENLLNIAEQSLLSRDMPRAETGYQKALTEAMKFGANSAEVQECETHLATVYVLQGKLPLAEPHYQKAKDMTVKLMKDGHGDPEAYVVLDDLSDAYQLAGASGNAEMCYQHCLALRQTISPKHKLLPTIEVLYGAELIKNGKNAEGEKYLTQGYDRSVSLTGVKSSVTGQLALSLATIYTGLGRWKEAEKYAADAETVARTGANGGAEVVANIARLHGAILTKLGRYKEAELEITSAEIIHKKNHGADHFEYAYDQVRMAKIYAETHRLNEAEALITQALATFQKNTKALKAVQVEALELGVKIAKQQHQAANATKYEAQLKSLNAKH